MREFIYRWRGLLCGFAGSMLAVQLLGLRGLLGYALGGLSVFVIWLWPRP